MFKKTLRKIILFGKFKMNNIISHSFDISLKTKIGKNSSIMKNCEIDAFSIIGNYNYIGNNCFITKANIGNYCSIANNVSIGPGEHNLSKISTNSILTLFGSKQKQTFANFSEDIIGLLRNFIFLLFNFL